MSSIGPGIITIFTTIVGLAMVAVIVSNKAQTPKVLQAGGTALSQIIGAAVSPVSGNGFGTAFGGYGAVSNMISGSIS